MSPVDAGNEILIPLYGADTATLFHITWSQDFATRNADYFLVTAYNITNDTQFPFFIATEFYKSSTKSNPNHISHVGELLYGEGYKLRVNDSLQYGQKNASGELRFVVYHDKERRAFQHRFIETAVASAAAREIQELATSFGLGAIGDKASSIAKNFIGDYFHTF